MFRFCVLDRHVTSSRMSCVYATTTKQLPTVLWPVRWPSFFRMSQLLSWNLYSYWARMIVEILRHEIGALSWVGLEINRFRLSACSRGEGEQIIRTNKNTFLVPSFWNSKLGTRGVYYYVLYLFCMAGDFWSQMTIIWARGQGTRFWARANITQVKYEFSMLVPGMNYFSVPWSDRYR